MAHDLLILSIVFLTTIITRFLPFWMFRNDNIPNVLIALGKTLPPALIGMLIVYCLKDTDIHTIPFGLNEVFGVIIAALLYLLSNIGIIAVIGATLSYMFLVQSNALDLLIAYFQAST